MLDINLLRHDPEYVVNALAKRGKSIDLSAFLELDQERRHLIHEVETLKAEKNQQSKQIPLLKKKGEDTAGIMEEMKRLSEQIKSSEARLAALDDEQYHFMIGLPNLPADSVVAGGKDNNQCMKVFGEKPSFSFSPRHHVDLAESLGLIDYQRGAKLSGSGFWIYRGWGAILERALLNYFIDEHLKDGYEMLLPPHILLYECGLTAGQFPKFEDDVFQLRDRPGDEASDRKDAAFTRFILPTAETAIVNLYRDEILDEKELPKKFFALTPCYRREAGSYRAEERGMIRGHQFNKVEMFQFTTPEDSEAALSELIEKACRLLQGLGLHFRLSKLAAGDVSASMRETWDIEVYIPSMGGYKEVSSVSQAGDYQARRGNLRYRNEKTQKAEFMHTLNGSGLATSRVFPAILEQFQNEDGSVTIPEVLRPYMQGKEKLFPGA